MHSLVYNGKQMLREGEGPKLDALRAPTDNDNWMYQPWYQNGLHNLKHKVVTLKVLEGNKGKSNTIQLMYTGESQAPNAAALLGGTSGRYSVKEDTSKPFGPDDFKFTTNQIWTIYADGSIELQSGITSNNSSLVLPRIGYAMQLDLKTTTMTVRQVPLLSSIQARLKTSL